MSRRTAGGWLNGRGSRVAVAMLGGDGVVVGGAPLRVWFSGEDEETAIRESQTSNDSAVVLFQRNAAMLFSKKVHLYANCNSDKTVEKTTTEKKKKY